MNLRGRVGIIHDLYEPRYEALAMESPQYASPDSRSPLYTYCEVDTPTSALYSSIQYRIVSSWALILTIN